ncbi:Blp family class II bacteriocin, partial [Streptococcus thermophilus]
MATQTIENFNTLDLETLASVEGGGCSWGGFAKQGVATG